CEPGLLRAQVQSSWKIEDIEQNAEHHHGAGESCNRHICVSFLACVRKCSSSAPLTGRTPPGAASAGLFLHARTIKMVVSKPKTRARNGMIHATRLKPVPVGAASTVGPYFCTKSCNVRSSFSPRSRPAMS